MPRRVAQFSGRVAQTRFHVKEFVDKYVPNQTFHTGRSDRARLSEAGLQAECDLPAGTYAERIMERLLIDLSWATSRMEERFGVPTQAFIA